MVRIFFDAWDSRWYQRDAGGTSIQNSAADGRVRVLVQSVSFKNNSSITRISDRGVVLKRAENPTGRF